MLCCIFQRTGLKSNPTPFPILPVTPNPTPKARPQPPERPNTSSYTLNPVLLLLLEEEEGAGKAPEEADVFREGEHAGIGWGGREAERKRVSKQERALDGPEESEVDSTGGHSALPNVYGLKASSLLFCWFVLVWLFCRVFSREEWTWDESVSSFEPDVSGRREREMRTGCANLILTILSTRY